MTVTLAALADKFEKERDKLASNQDRIEAEAIRSLTPKAAIHYLPRNCPAWVAANVYDLVERGEQGAAVLFKLCDGLLNDEVTR